MIQTAQDAINIYKMLRPNSGPSQGEVDGSAGKRTYKSFVDDAGPEIAQRDTNLKAQETQLGNLNTTINQLNQTVTDVTGDNKATKAQLQDTLIEVSKLTADLSTAHDQIKQLQTLPPPPTQAPGKSLWDVIKDFLSGFKKGF